MLTSAWSPVPDEVIAEQFLEVDVDHFYLPTPPTFESENDHLFYESQVIDCGNTPIEQPVIKRKSRKSDGTGTSGPKQKYYCLNCTKAFSRMDSLRRHKKLYCKREKKETEAKQVEIMEEK